MYTEEKKAYRIQWLDAVRVVAILMVLCVHVTEKFYFYNGVEFTARSVPSQIVGMTLFTFGRLGVPLFLFISGYLLLQREYNNDSCMRFWKKNLCPLLICVEIWTVIYYFFLYFLNDTEFNLWTLIRQMLFLRKSDMSHTWYLPMIIGIYIFIPLVAVVLQKFDIKKLLIPLIIAITYLMLVPDINYLLEANDKLGIVSQLDLNFTGGVYGIYLIIGYLFARKMFDKVKKYMWAVIFVISMAITVIFQMYMYSIDSPYKVFYNFFFLVPAAMAVFGLLKNCNFGEFASKVVKRLARDSFGIYLVHKPVQMVLTNYKVFFSLNTSMQIVCTYIVLFLISFVIVEIIALIPGVNSVLILVSKNKKIKNNNKIQEGAN